MNTNIVSLLKQLPKFRADNVFKDKLQRQIINRDNIKLRVNWRLIGLFSTSLVVVVLAIGGYQMLYQRQLPLRQQLNDSEKVTLPQSGDASGKSNLKFSQPENIPCTQNADPCDSNSCSHDLKLCQKKYVCPKSGYIDCMPIVLPERQFQCNRDYIDWAEKNCPDFKGVTN